MDLILLFTLSLCWWTAAARSTWTDKPWLLVHSEIEDGQTVKVSCTLPIDYTGGDCRLFRDGSGTPFRTRTATDYVCVFYLTSQQLLGDAPVGSRVFLKCDYQLQHYRSTFSDIRGVTVRGSCPRPGLSVSHHLVSPDDNVEVTCSPPLRSVSSCVFYRDQVYIAEGSCSRNLTGRQLAIWEKNAVLLPVNMTCRYYPRRHLEIRSEPSEHRLLFVVDVRQTSSSVDCQVLWDNQMITGSSWTFGGPDGPTVTVQVSNSTLTTPETCTSRAV